MILFYLFGGQQLRAVHDMKDADAHPASYEKKKLFVWSDVCHVFACFLATPQQKERVEVDGLVFFFLRESFWRLLTGRATPKTPSWISWLHSADSTCW